MIVFDFNSLIDFGQVTFGKILKGLANAHRTNSFLTTDRLPAKTSVRQMDRSYLDFAGLYTFTQNLSFFGTSENSVKTQIRIAISVYVLAAIVKKELSSFVVSSFAVMLWRMDGIELSLGEILQILSIVLFEKVPITQVLTKNISQNEIFILRRPTENGSRIHNQLLLFNL